MKNHSLAIIYNPTLVFHGTIIALHEKPEFLTLNKSRIRPFIQGNNCAMKNQSWMAIPQKKLKPGTLSKKKL